MSKEIGGFIELERNYGKIFHEDSIYLNCGRSCLEYVIRAKNIKKMKLPVFSCGSIFRLCEKVDVKVSYYNTNYDFSISDFCIEDDEWVLLINFYGQYSNDYIKAISEIYSSRVIVDNTQSFFQKPVNGIDTFYNCRKYFGVPDGGFLYTDTYLGYELDKDQSRERFEHILGRFEKSAKEYYNNFKKNEGIFKNLPCLKMSELTENFLRGVNFEYVLSMRKNNAKTLDKELKSINELDVNLENCTFMYPLYIPNANEIRTKLIENNIYIPVLWPNVVLNNSFETIEHKMADGIIPLPIDQRYSTDDMLYMIGVIKKCLD